MPSFNGSASLNHVVRSLSSERPAPQLRRTQLRLRAVGAVRHTVRLPGLTLTPASGDLASARSQGSLNHTDLQWIELLEELAQEASDKTNNDQVDHGPPPARTTRTREELGPTALLPAAPAEAMRAAGSPRPAAAGFAARLSRTTVLLVGGVLCCVLSFIGGQRLGQRSFSSGGHAAPIAALPHQGPVLPPSAPAPSAAADSAVVTPARTVSPSASISGQEAQPAPARTSRHPAVRRGAVHKRRSRAHHGQRQSGHRQ